MTILSLVLYGSCARSDNHKDSDVDLFAITTDPHYRMIVDKKINIANYPEQLAMKRASAGDLYFLHIVHEGRRIYDTGQFFDQLKDAFRYKENYSAEIKNAVELGWLLLRFSDQISNITLLNRRIAWCVRTILIAKSAEARTPKFSAKDLADLLNFKHTELLIKNKSQDKINLKTLSYFEEFLNDMNETIPSELIKLPLNEANKYFIRSNNVVGAKTFNLINNQFCDGYI